MLPHIDRTVADLRDVIASTDLVIAGPLSVVARLVAEQAGVPVTTVMLQPMAFRSVVEPPRMREAPLANGIARRCGPGAVRRAGALAPAMARADGAAIVADWVARRFGELEVAPASTPTHVARCG